MVLHKKGKSYDCSKTARLVGGYLVMMAIAKSRLDTGKLM